MLKEMLRSLTKAVWLESSDPLVLYCPFPLMRGPRFGPVMLIADRVWVEGDGGPAPWSRCRTFGHNGRKPGDLYVPASYLPAGAVR